MYSSTQKRLFSISRDFSKLFAEALDKMNTSCFVDTSDDVKLVYYFKKLGGTTLPLLLLRKRCFRGSLLVHSLSRFVLRFTHDGFVTTVLCYKNIQGTGLNGFKSAVSRCEPPTVGLLY